jgi:hypothetical protein
VGVRRARSFASRVGVGIGVPIACVIVCMLASVSACEGSNTNTAGGPAAPLGAGYDDVRVLSRDDCMALRDHQIEIAVNDALVDSDAWTADAAQHLVLEADLRLKEKAATDAWIQRCTGRMVPSADLRCMRESTTSKAFISCGAIDDAGPGDGGEAGEAPAASEET